MKLLRFFLLSLIAMSLFNSCQKDTSFEAGVARGALSKDVNGDCLFITPTGNFQKSVALTANSFIKIEVILSEAGSYNIKTDTVNGYSFSDIGIGYVGLNVLFLKASGKPVNVGIDEFKIKFDGSICKAYVSVGNAPTTTLAAFSFVGAPGTCIGATQNPTATFMQGITTNATNWVDIAVNVTTAGTYAINTGANAVNGVKYSGSGNLNTGNQTIRLTADGGLPPPTGLSGTYNYSINGSGSSCGFDVVYQSFVASASYTFNCGTAFVQGSYVTGTPTTSANSITLPITLTTSGSYNITASNNGVTFANSGILATGATSIILFATGTGANTGISIYTITGGGGSSCSVNVNFTGGGTFVEFIKAKVNGATTFTDFSTGADASIDNTTGSILSITGSGSFPEDIDFSIATAAAATPNIPYAVNLTNGIVTCNYTNSASTDFTTNNLVGATLSNPFKITITTNDGTIVKGTFSGTVRDSGGTGTAVTFTEGSFEVYF
jgi:hypothetical protein